MIIANGRAGTDKGVGKTTCSNASVDDVVAISPELLGYIDKFYIDDFDKMLSDVHSPVNFTFLFDKINANGLPERKRLNRVPKPISKSVVDNDNPKHEIIIDQLSLDSINESLDRDLINLNGDKGSKDFITKFDDTVKKICGMLIVEAL